MRFHGRRPSPAWLVALALLLLPATAGAADPGSATITACRTDSMTVAGKVIVRGRSARKVRRATLQMRFQAFPLFGLPQSAKWRSVGRKRRASGQETFSSLGADNWIGVLSWRYTRGHRTVLSGIARSERMRIGHKRGIANCTLYEGAKPVDKNPPSLYLLPSDANWHRAPAAVQIVAQDDFSGVARVQYRVDGGAVTNLANGGTFTIPNEGAHTVTYSATDVAGNTTIHNAQIKVDAAPPTKPVVTGPAAVTVNRQPTISWSPSSDTGSGIRGYFVAIRRADGSAVVLQPVDANTTSLASPAVLDDGQTYTVTITAVDNTADKAWTTDSDPYTFRVDTQAEATGFRPASGTVLAGNLKNGPFSIDLDRAADPATVSTSTVVLHNIDGSQPTYSAGCANTPCTTITVAPSAALGEGRYSLTLNGVKSAGEGITFSGSAAYAVPFVENQSGISAGGGFCLGDATNSVSKSLTAADGSETGTFDFDWSYASGGAGWTAQAYSGSTAIGDPVNGGPGSGHSQLRFPIPSGTNTIKFQITSKCSGNSSSQLSATNIVGTRQP